MSEKWMYVVSATCIPLKWDHRGFRSQLPKDANRIGKIGTHKGDRLRIV